MHLGAIGLGIVGDPVYRPRRKPAIGPALQAFLQGFERIALHAYLLGFEHPISGAPLRFERPAPAVFDQLFELLTEQASDSSLVNPNGVNHSGMREQPPGRQGRR